jgi:hypothetical protein
VRQKKFRKPCCQPLGCVDAPDGTAAQKMSLILWTRQNKIVFKSRKVARGESGRLHEFENDDYPDSKIVLASDGAEIRASFWRVGYSRLERILDAIWQ